MTTAPNRTFIRASEVWVPTADGTELALENGLYDDVPQFGALSRPMRFRRGDGLPGRVWDEGRPMLLDGFPGSFFRRTEAAGAVDLTCGIAVPWYRAGALSAVLVLFCGDRQAHAGAIELWHNDPRVTGDMTLHAGYYGTSPEALATLSRDTYLPRGAGLPGLAWQRGEAVFIDDLAASARFLRGDTTRSAGIDRAFAFPCALPGDTSWVITFLSAADTPIARRMERWVPDARGKVLQRVAVAGEPDATPVEVMLDRGGSPLVRAFLTGAPAIGERVDEAPGLVALPIYADEVVSEVVVLAF